MIAAICLAWVFHDVQLEPMLRSVRELRWTWVGLAVLVDVGSYVVQGLRWKLLLRPVGNLPSLDAVQAVYAGLFANEILPMRPGEVLRAYVVSRRLGVGLSPVLPSIVVERLFDGVWLSLGVGIVAALLPLPNALEVAADLLGGLIVVGTALFLYEVVRRGGRPAAADTEGRLQGRLARFRQGFHEIGRRRESYLAFGLSLAVLAGQALAFWLVMLAYGLTLSMWEGAVALIIVNLGTAVPNAPANVGTYQLACVLGLTLLGVDKTLATGFSVIVFVILTVPLWALGFLALGRSGASIASLRARAGR